MADTPELYRNRAAMERANADASSLDNVRDRCERAARAWEDMASRLERTAALRIERENASAATHERMLVSAGEA
ncbi:hypothetical protein [Sphingomonas sp.]|jgi:hypothetical protein|uniref:hypothetical protein n=1 Tax=Sphingomonas sp. TaxID=28214 RepID=UPI002E328304|nr:hypothetical protein [Sphingomonas sp.]HEX4693225.1 hypothetical protein [Sphingomonas sp.]